MSVSMNLARQNPSAFWGQSDLSTTTRRVTPQEVGTSSEAATQEAGLAEEQSAPAGPSRTGLDPQQGLQVARTTLDARGNLAQASVQFEQLRGPDTLERTPQGEARAVRRAMTRMGDDMFHQHTGNGGESYSKDQLGQMLNALKGSPTVAAPPVPRGNRALHLAASQMAAPAVSTLPSTQVTAA